MTLYQKFKKLDIDFSQLGLEPGDTCGDYFCDPMGAEVIGWVGVDGIHCCFIEGFGEMVFAVNPSNLPGDYVHPLARSFEDFLRLILACGLDAAEQAWMWNRGEFDGFMETYPSGPEQQVALDGLRAGLGLTPMDDPYGYIKEVQSDFDYGKIPYSKEYYELMPEPEPAGLPERPDWKVYFDNGFGSHHTGHDKPGRELFVNQTFTWGGKVWHIPTVYVCGKGLVVDLCMEVDPAELQSFMEKWWPHGEEEGREFTPEEQEQQNAENPSNMDFTPRLTVNSRELGGWSGNGCGWVPDSCRPESERWQSRQNWEAIWLMEHYGFDPERGWMFWRYSFPWATKTRPVLKAVSLSLEQNPVSVPGIRFTVSGAGDSVPFIHPVTGETHTLRVVEYETQQMDANHFHDKEQWEYPTCYTAMSFTVEPELPRQSLTVRDSGQGDRPRLKQPDMVGPTAARSVGIILANSKNSQTWTVCSSLYFAWPERIEWRMVFRQKTVKDIKLDLPLTQK